MMMMMMMMIMKANEMHYFSTTRVNYEADTACIASNKINDERNISVYHHHYHVSVMELGHLLTRSGLTYPEVSSKVCHDFFLPVEEECFIILGNLLRGILFTCCIQFLLYSSNLAKCKLFCNNQRLRMAFFKLLLQYCIQPSRKIATS